jgi:hypothetical protein
LLATQTTFSHWAVTATIRRVMVPVAVVAVVRFLLTQQITAVIFRLMCRAATEEVLIMSHRLVALVPVAVVVLALYLPIPPCPEMLRSRRMEASGDLS